MCRTLKEPITTFEPNDHSDSGESLKNFGAEAYLEPAREEKEENDIFPCSNCELLEGYNLDNRLLRHQVALLELIIKNTRLKSFPKEAYEFLDELCEKPEDENFSSDSSYEETPLVDV